MAIKKKRKSTTRKSTARKSTTRKSTARKSTTRKSTARKSTTRRTAKQQTTKDIVVMGVTGIVGAVAAAAIATRIPAGDARVKAALPLLLGIGAVATKQGRKNKMLKSAAVGAMVAGGLATLKQINPNIPLLAGEDEYYDEVEDFPMGGPILAGPVLAGEALLGYDDGYGLSGDGWK